MTEYQPAFVMHMEWIGRESSVISDHAKKNIKTRIKALGGDIENIVLSMHAHKLPVPEGTPYVESGGYKIRTDDGPFADFIIVATAPKK